MEEGTKPTKMYGCGKIVKKKHRGFPKNAKSYFLVEPSHREVELKP